MLDEDEIKERFGEGLSKEKMFKKRCVTNLSFFKYPTLGTSVSSWSWDVCEERRRNYFFS
jgi:hypothetical protein